MNAAFVQELSGWLAATDIGFLELRGPDVHLCLRHDSTRVEVVPPGTRAIATPATVPVTSPSVGVFLHTHPLHDAPLAAPGQAVVAGQVIGLLQIGALLLPVIAPRDGIVARHAAAPGKVVGYGAHLADLVPSSPA